jgi:AcrR family transcriptional regulator
LVGAQPNAEVRAGRTGTAVSSFYTYFSSKQDVFTAVMRVMIAAGVA